jgi:separase
LSRDQYLKWPKIATSEKQTLGSASDFQRDYIDIIPSSWTTISLSLNEAQDELYLTRYESGFSPFILRLPLSRHASREMDEQEFTFEDGKRDLEETIELSDFSTRSAKDMVSREARMQWWTEREALDTKLHELLLNMENIWLGGFKGIFSSHVRQPALLARFKKSFENVLNRHLPSRRGKKQQHQPTLDTRIFELFVGLGDATNEELDMDDALMDLIYFVVDVLHFNGEHNAYDEIEFDTMVIETLDALRAYHNACAGVSVDSAHTILILDKSLHIFPWESLPCLQSLSISRLPSMAALRERLLAARPSNSTKDAPPGHYISADTGGTSILNPSGDLSHTLKTLKPRLDCMPGQWTHIANRAPSEKEFESALKDKDLALYFGHGSGAQFVRSKSVRRLYPGTETGQHAKPGCATTFLFGCSSAHLTENGIYESSGMLASYLVAGAPAVVGMLWDVTDKDCDRFAVKTGELWGLWPELKEEVDVPKTANKKGKGKGKAVHVVAEMEGARGTGTAKSTRKGRGASPNEGQQASGVGKVRRGVGLNEAVREARDVCVLRYLNGAAAVVYGIPVYLE